MSVFAKFDEIPSMTLQDIKETKRYGHTVGRSPVGRTFGQRENSIPSHKTVCGGYNYPSTLIAMLHVSFVCILLFLPCSNFKMIVGIFGRLKSVNFNVTAVQNQNFLSS